MCILYVCLKALELLRCLYESHWKELTSSVSESTAVERWCLVWVTPVIDMIISDRTSATLRTRLSDVSLPDGVRGAQTRLLVLC